MSYLLDTNAVIAILRGRPPIVRARPRRLVSRAAPIAVSSVVLYELWYGIAPSERRQENRERPRIFLSSGINVISFDEEDALSAGDLRASPGSCGNSDRAL